MSKFEREAHDAADTLAGYDQQRQPGTAWYGRGRSSARRRSGRRE
ncbi:hypothetical protein [Pseudoduganella chitinolytica]|uniref:Uncharacterized protein n=1 Tax=Pseudoduganella chitinolytica TaxID=34070 RepID=A0ABY8BGU8_9BURK|nr:hypothetical protein [Pseudoduganella chitinolytica]WEF34901.1 hypothetical protein PX653_09115 [Pseudoduganella chitinolytica]